MGVSRVHVRLTEGLGAGSIGGLRGIIKSASTYKFFQ